MDQTPLHKMLYGYKKGKEAKWHFASWPNSDMALTRLKPRKVIQV